MMLKSNKKEFIVYKFFKRVKSQKGISGVVVALMLVLVGVIAVVGIQTFLTGQKNTVTTETANQVNTIVSGG